MSRFKASRWLVWIGTVSAQSLCVLATGALGPFSGCAGCGALFTIHPKSSRSSDHLRRLDECTTAHAQCATDCAKLWDESNRVSCRAECDQTRAGCLKLASEEK